MILQVTHGCFETPLMAKFLGFGCVIHFNQCSSFHGHFPLSLWSQVVLYALCGLGLGLDNLPVASLPDHTNVLAHRILGWLEEEEPREMTRDEMAQEGNYLSWSDWTHNNRR